MAGQGRVRSAGDRRRCGLRGGVRGTGVNSASLGTRLPSLAHRLLTCSLAPSLCAACPPARLLPAAGCLLALSLALPAFAAHAGSYVTAKRRGSGVDGHVLCAAALRFGSRLSFQVRIPRVPVLGKRRVRGRVAGAGLLRTEPQRDSGAVWLSASSSAPAFTEGT